MKTKPTIKSKTKTPPRPPLKVIQTKPHLHVTMQAIPGTTAERGPWEATIQVNIIEPSLSLDEHVGTVILPKVTSSEDLSDKLHNLLACFDYAKDGTTLVLHKG